MFRQWKHYRGGTTSRIWIMNLDDLSVSQVPQPEGRCNDIDPMWLGSTVYFLSDRDGEFNLYSFERGGKAVEKLTDHTDFPIEDASAGAGKVIYEQAGYLHVYDPKLAVPNPRRGSRSAWRPTWSRPGPRLATGEKFIRSAAISPTGKRAAFEFRGEVVTVPAKKGDIRNLTQSPGVHERGPIWSPDGKSIAYFSDEGGEYALHVRPQDGSGEAKSYALGGLGLLREGGVVARLEEDRRTSTTRGRSTSWTSTSGKVKRIASERIYGPVNTMSFAWSPDSRWVAYTLTNSAYFQTLRIYSVEKDESHTLNDGPGRDVRAQVRREREVPLFPRLDRRRAGQAMVRPVQRRHAGDALDLRRGAPQGPRLPRSRSPATRRGPTRATRPRTTRPRMTRTRTRKRFPM